MMRIPILRPFEISLLQLLMILQAAACSSLDETVQIARHLREKQHNGPSDDSSTADTFAAARKRCVEVINAYRAGKNVALLDVWTSAESCLDGQAKNDATVGRPQSSIGRCREAAQNTCENWSASSPEESVAACLAVMYAEGAGGVHHDILMDPTFSRVACGFFRTSAGKFWIVQDFQ